MACEMEFQIKPEYINTETANLQDKRISYPFQDLHFIDHCINIHTCSYRGKNDEVAFVYFVRVQFAFHYKV